MNKLLIGLLTLSMSYTVLAEIKSHKTLDNGDGSVTVHPYRTTSLRDNCGYDLTADIGINSNKNRICRKLGFKSYVKKSLVINYQSTLRLGTFIESISPCMGDPVGTSKGIESINCIIE